MIKVKYYNQEKKENGKGLKFLYPNGDEKNVLLFNGEGERIQEKFLQEIELLLRGYDENGNSYQLDFAMDINGIMLGYAKILESEGYHFETTAWYKNLDLDKLKPLKSR